MNRGPALTVLTVAIAASLACESQRLVGLTASDEAAIRQAIDIEMKAANEADAAGWASVYAQDAIVLRPHAPAVQGREAIQQWLATLPPISNAKGQGLEIEGYGDLAYLRGTYTMTFSIPGAPAPIDETGQVSADLSQAKRRFVEDDTRNLQLGPSTATAPAAAGQIGAQHEWRRRPASVSEIQKADCYSFFGAHGQP